MKIGSRFRRTTKPAADNAGVGKEHRETNAPKHRRALGAPQGSNISEEPMVDIDSIATSYLHSHLIQTQRST